MKSLNKKKNDKKGFHAFFSLLWSRGLSRSHKVDKRCVCDKRTPLPATVYNYACGWLAYQVHKLKKFALVLFCFVRIVINNKPFYDLREKYFLQ